MTATTRVCVSREATVAQERLRITRGATKQLRRGKPKEAGAGSARDAYTRAVARLLIYDEMRDLRAIPLENESLRDTLCILQ